MAQYAAAGAILAGAAVKGYGEYEQGVTAKRAMSYEAKLAKRQAQVAMWAMQIQKDIHRRKIFEIIHNARAAAVGSGVLVTGSPLEVIMEAAREGEYEQQLIEYEAKLKALGLKSEAKLYEYSGKAAKRAGKFRMAGTLLTGTGMAMGAAYRPSAGAGGGEDTSSGGGSGGEGAAAG